MDEIICHVAQLLRNAVRSGDLTGRIGGEDFLAICLETDCVGIIQLAERLCTAIENQAIKIAGADHLLSCTVTIGISPNFHDMRGLKDALRQADSALYRGKATGRNRVELSNTPCSNSDQNAEAAIAHL